MTRAHTEERDAFPPAVLRAMSRALLASPLFAAHTLNRDFVGARGFSVVFRRDGRAEVERAFPAVRPFLARVLQPECTAFYLNPLLLERGSRVDPHVDRSLRSYCKTIEPPLAVAVLYLDVPPRLAGGALVLARGRKQLARIRPETGALVVFEGDLLHSVEPLSSAGARLSLVCEQYRPTPAELELVPRYAIETRAKSYA